MRATRSSSRSGTPASASRPRCSPGSSTCSPRATGRIARSEGGLGIGLTLVRTLVEMHGGSVSATSEGPAGGASSPSACPPRPARPVAATARRRGLAGGAPGRSRPRRRRQRGYRPGAWPGSWSSSGHDVAGGPRRPRRPSKRPAPTGPMSSCWTSACPAWTATRSRAGSGEEMDSRRGHHRRLRLRPGGRPRRSQEAGFDHHLVKPVELRHPHDLARGSYQATSSIMGTGFAKIYMSKRLWFNEMIRIVLRREYRVGVADHARR